MYKEKKILALITARGGSKGIPRKNIISLGEKPLLAWTIEEAKKSKYIDRLVISTDDDEIIDTALKYGCEVPFKRPAELALDKTTSMDVVIHALSILNACNEFDFLLLLQPTSPFRKSESIDDAISFCINNNYPMVVSVAQSKKRLLYLFYEGIDNGLIPVFNIHEKNTRRQDQKTVYEHNGAIYFSDIHFLSNVKTYNCPEARLFEMTGFENIDIDTPEDLLYARLLVENGLI